MWGSLAFRCWRRITVFTHEGGVATPLLAHWPSGIRAPGGMRRQPGHLIDIMATCVEVSGAEYPLTFQGRDITPLEGSSLVPAFAGRALDRDAIYFEHEGNRAVLTDTWKLVARGRTGAWELYDMEIDRTETQDLAPSLPGEVQGMESLWDSWARRTHVVPWESPA